MSFFFIAHVFFFSGGFLVCGTELRDRTHARDVPVYVGLCGYDVGLLIGRSRVGPWSQVLDPQLLRRINEINASRSG